MRSGASTRDDRAVPVRTTLAAIGLVLATAILLYVVIETERVITWFLIAAFFAVALYPAQGRPDGGRGTPPGRVVR